MNIRAYFVAIVLLFSLTVIVAGIRAQSAPAAPDHKAVHVPASPAIAQGPEPSTNVHEMTKATAKHEPPPVLTDASKLAIRNAQIDVMNSWRAVEQSPQWQTYQASVATLKGVVATQLEAASADPAKWQVNDQLEVVPVGSSLSPVPQPAADPSAGGHSKGKK